MLKKSSRFLLGLLGFVNLRSALSESDFPKLYSSILASYSLIILIVGKGSFASSIDLVSFLVPFETPVIADYTVRSLAMLANFSSGSVFYLRLKTAFSSELVCIGFSSLSSS